jgi:hypothetical protein
MTVIKPKTKPKRVKPPSRIQPAGPPGILPVTTANGSTGGGSTFSTGPSGDNRYPSSPAPAPTNIDPNTRVYDPTPTQHAGGPPRAYFDGGAGLGGGGGGASGSNPLVAGTVSSAIESSDLDSILHGGKRKGRIRRTRGTE